MGNSKSKEFRKFSTSGGDGTETDTSYCRHRPPPLDYLQKITKFDKRELQLLYRGFKDVKIEFFFNFYFH